jgi:hypothetical protein
MLGKDAPSPRELARASRSATPPLHVRAADGLRALRERLAARHASRRAAFAQLPTDGGGRVAMGALVAGLHVLGFPRSLCDASELRQVVRGFAASPAALSISFAEFCELLAADATRCAAALRAASDEGAAASSQQQQQQQQQQQKLQVAAAASALARSSELAAVKGKLRSGSMRELFLALDADRDGFVSLSDAARGLGAHGLSQPSAASAALAALLEAHARTRGGMLSFAELAAFVQEGEVDARTLTRAACTHLSRAAQTRRVLLRRQRCRDRSRAAAATRAALRRARGSWASRFRPRRRWRCCARTPRALRRGWRSCCGHMTSRATARSGERRVSARAPRAARAAE